MNSTNTSMNTLTKEEWTKFYGQLADMFGDYSPNPGAKMTMMFAELSKFKTETVKQAIRLIIRTHERFPSVSQLLETIHQLDPPPDPVVEASRREAEEWQRAEFERKQILRTIDNLPEERRFKLIEQAKHDCEKFEGWPAYSIVFNARLIMIYREKYAY